MQSTSRPIVYISYAWIDENDQRTACSGRVPDPEVRQLAERLRSNGVDVRLDVYFRDSLYGFFLLSLSSVTDETPGLLGRPARSPKRTPSCSTARLTTLIPILRVVGTEVIGKTGTV